MKTKQLFRIQLKVTPKPWHPVYWEWEYGLLNIFVYAADGYEAAVSAIALNHFLPYEHLADTPPAVIPVADLQLADDVKPVIGVASKVGVAAFLEAVNTGQGDGAAGLERFKQMPVTERPQA